MEKIHLKAITRAFVRPLRTSIYIPEQYIVNTAIIIVLVSFLFLISGCHYYKVITKTTCESENMLSDLLNHFYPEKRYPRQYYSEGNLVIMLFKEHDVYVVDSTGKWLLEDPIFNYDTLTCNSTFSPKPADSIISVENRKHMRYYPSTEADIVKRINLHVMKLSVNESGMVFIPVSTIEKYDIYKKNKGKTIWPPTLIATCSAVFIFVIVAIVSLNNISLYK